MPQESKTYCAFFMQRAKEHGLPPCHTMTTTEEWHMLLTRCIRKGFVLERYVRFA